VKLAPFRAVIFDCDGVLVDSEPLGLRSLQQVLHEVGVERSLDSLARYSGRSHGETLAELEAESGVALLESAVSKQMDERYIRLVEAEGLHPCPGIPQLLSWLSAHEIQSTGLETAFPYFLCGDDVVRAKPAPDLYLAAAVLVGVDPTECVAIEDAPGGVRSARAAGMQVIGVTTSFGVSALAEADLIVESLSFLPQYFAGLPPLAS
jgi:HAD superfamily hydrolase (TIGR01509 family)